MEPVPHVHALTRFARLAALVLFVALALGFHAGAARADDAIPADARAPSGLDPALEQQVRTLALGAGGAPPSGVTRVEVVVGQLDPRLRLAPCQRVEPYLPNGTRLWGRSRIGLRCAQGPSAWNVYLPITVKAYGSGLVAASALASGSVLKPADLVPAEIDLAEDVTPALLDSAQAIGRTLAQSLRPGQGLRQSHLKLRQFFVAGDTVKVVAMGAGFSLEGEGQAMSNGVEGQTARVRTENGRILIGLPAGDRRMELAP